MAPRKTPEEETGEERKPIVRITAKRKGFRRCGVEHSTKPTVWYEGDFTAAQLKQLQAEPMLVVDVDPAALADDEAKDPAPQA